jgi:hypothetical protein
MRRYNQGWKSESERHSLAAQGVKTGRKYNFYLKKDSTSFKKVPAGEWRKLTDEHYVKDNNDIYFDKVDGMWSAILYRAGTIHDEAIHGEIIATSRNLKELKDETKTYMNKDSLTSKGFVPNADDLVHEKAFELDTQKISDRLTPEKVDYLINDESKAVKEYKGLGLESLSHDEARHEHLLGKLKKENNTPLAMKDKKNVVVVKDWKKNVDFFEFPDKKKMKSFIKEVKKHHLDYATLASQGKKIHTAKFDRTVKAIEKSSHGSVNPYAVAESRLGYEASILPKHRRR